MPGPVAKNRRELWDRRQRIAELKAAGMPASQIAAEVGITTRTVWIDIQRYYEDSARSRNTASELLRVAASYEHMYTRCMARLSEVPKGDFAGAATLLREGRANRDALLRALGYLLPSQTLNIGPGAGGSFFGDVLNAQNENAIQDRFRSDPDSLWIVIEALRRIHEVGTPGGQVEPSLPGRVLPPPPQGAEVSPGVASPRRDASERDSVRADGSWEVQPNDGMGDAGEVRAEPG